MKIDMGSKTYKTVGGLPVRVLCVDYTGVVGYPVLALATLDGRDSVFIYTECGEIYGVNDNCNLVETSMWDDVPVDAKILVRDNEGNRWNPRHFAKYANGLVYTWTSGMTSHSCECENSTNWKFAKLA